MIIAKTGKIAGHRIVETRGVCGLVMRSRDLAGNLSAGLRSVVDYPTEYSLSGTP